MNDKVKLFDQGIIWDEHDKVIDPTWAHIKELSEKVHGGLGILAADFNELVRYGYGDPWHRRNTFKKIVSAATSDEDIEYLAEILSCMLCSPYKTNPDAGWFIYLLRKGPDLDKFDAGRAAKVLNELYTINPYAASILVRTLRDFVENIDERNSPRTQDLILQTGLLNENLVLDTNPARIFVSYAREDNEIMENIFEGLKARYFDVWKDNHSLMVGQNWRVEIMQKLETTDFAVIGVSETSMTKEGFFKLELEWAIERYEKSKDDDIVLLPVRLDDVTSERIPNAINNLHILDVRDGLDATLASIEVAVSKSRKGWKYRR
jgi:hypothetical protein